MVLAGHSSGHLTCMQHLYGFTAWILWSFSPPLNLAGPIVIGVSLWIGFPGYLFL